MKPAKHYDHANPKMGHAVFAEANHSVYEPSVDNDLGAHSQADEELADEQPPEDPNMSGTSPTLDMHPWLSGKMDGWSDNDDYRNYFEKSVGCDGMLVCDPNDGDYDDNGGIPTALGSSDNAKKAKAYGLAPVIRRRI